MNWEKIVEAWLLGEGFATISMIANANPQISRKMWAVVFERMVNRGQIKSFALRGREHAFIFTGKRCKELGLHPKKSRPPGAQSLITHLGYMLFSAERRMRRFKKSDLEERAPGLLVRGLSSDRYIELPDGVIGLLIVDCGSDVRHLARKAQKEISRRRKASPDWEEAFRLNGFRPVLILGDEGKGRRLRSRLTDRGTQADVVVYDDLGSFIMEKTQ